MIYINILAEYPWRCPRSTRGVGPFNRLPQTHHQTPHQIHDRTHHRTYGRTRHRTHHRNPPRPRTQPRPNTKRTAEHTTKSTIKSTIKQTIKSIKPFGGKMLQKCHYLRLYLTDRLYYPQERDLSPCQISSTSVAPFPSL